MKRILTVAAAVLTVLIGTAAPAQAIDEPPDPSGSARIEPSETADPDRTGSSAPDASAPGDESGGGESNPSPPRECRIRVDPQPIPIIHLRMSDDGGGADVDGRGTGGAVQPGESTVPDSDETGQSEPPQDPDGTANAAPGVGDDPEEADQLQAKLGDGFLVQELSMEAPEDPTSPRGLQQLEDEIEQAATAFEGLTAIGPWIVVYDGATNEPLGAWINRLEATSAAHGAKRFESRSVDAVVAPELETLHAQLVAQRPATPSGDEPPVHIESIDGGTDARPAWQVMIPSTPGRSGLGSQPTTGSPRIGLFDDETAKVFACEEEEPGATGPVTIVEAIDTSRPWRAYVVDESGGVTIGPRSLRADETAAPIPSPLVDRSGSGGSSSPLPIVLAAIGGLVVGLIASVLSTRRQTATAMGPEYPMPYTPAPPHGMSSAPAATPTESFHPIPAGERDLTLRPQPAPPGWTGAVHGDRSPRLGELGLNRLLPRDRESGRSWAYEAEGITAIAGWTEKRAGRGEDAEPTLRVHDRGAVLLAVFDGMGGSGAALARRLRDGTELTGAYLSSRLARDVTEAWAIRQLGQGPIGSPDPLTAALAGALRDEASIIPDTSGIRGSLSRTLPTTAAILTLSPLAHGGMRAEAIWAGDSRAFALTAERGLQVLTVDDTRETDALELIRNDQPMQNLVSADKPFVLHHQALDRDEPAVFIVATDGCFGYVATPAHFEFHLLDTLQQAGNVGEWADRLVERLGAIAADDVSFSIAATRYPDFASLQQAFTARYRQLEEDHWAIFETAGDDHERRERLRNQSWEAYRDAYEELMPNRGSRF